MYITRFIRTPRLSHLNKSFLLDRWCLLSYDFLTVYIEISIIYVAVNEQLFLELPFSYSSRDIYLPIFLWFLYRHHVSVEKVELRNSACQIRWCPNVLKYAESRTQSKELNLKHYTKKFCGKITWNGTKHITITWRDILHMLQIIGKFCYHNRRLPDHSTVNTCCFVVQCWFR